MIVPYHRRVKIVHLKSIKDSGNLIFNNSCNVNDFLYEMKMLNFSEGLIQVEYFGFMSLRSQTFLEDSSVLNSLSPRYRERLYSY